MCNSLIKKMKADQPEMMSKSSRDALQQIAAKRSKKKTSPVLKTDYVALFIILLVILISIFTLPDDWKGVSVQHVWYYGWITAVSTGVGVLPFFFFSEPNKFWMGISNGKRTYTLYLFNYIFARVIESYCSSKSYLFSGGGWHDDCGVVQLNSRRSELRADPFYQTGLNDKSK